MGEIRVVSEIVVLSRMLKRPRAMKEVEALAGEALRRVLEKIPILHIEEIDAER